MPLINGLKMACEPCIRGHRSTSCNHASERVMVPVRKPGRPLNECPHPRGSNCECKDITVAIPRKRKCECVGDKSSAPKTSITQTSAEASRPSSATPVKEQPGEVSSCCQPKAQVPAASSASIPPTISMPLAPASVSAPVTSSAPQPPLAPLNGTIGPPWNTTWNLNFSSLNQPQIGYPFQGYSGSLPQTPQPLQIHQPVQLAQPVQSTPPASQLPKKSDSDDEAEGRTSGEETGSSGTADGPSTRSSCCSTRSSSITQFAPSPDTTSPESSASSYAGHSRSNSKSRTTPRLRIDRQNMSTRNGAIQQPMPDSAIRPPFSAMIQSPVSQVPAQPITAHPPACTNCGHNQPAMLIYLPFGSIAQPVGFAGTGGPVYVVQQPASMNVAPPAEFTRQPPVTAITVPMGGCASDTTGLGTIHECNCGPGCQCIGCIAHPFNDATQEYIRSAQNAYEDFGPSFMDPTAVPPAQSIANLTLSPEQILAPEDFFFVDYSSARGVYHPV